VETPAMITGHRGNGALGPDFTGPENQPTAARSGVAAITAGQTLIRTFGCNSCVDNGSANTEILSDSAEAKTAALLSKSLICSRRRNAPSRAVGQTVSSVDGAVLTVKYRDGDKKIIVGPSVPVSRLEVANKSELKSGVAVAAAAATKKPDGTFTAARIDFGRGDVLP